MSHCSAHCPSRRSRSAVLLRDPFRDLSIGHSSTERNCEHDLPDNLAESSCLHFQWRSEIRCLPAEISIQPSVGLRKYGQRCALYFYYTKWGLTLSPILGNIVLAYFEAWLSLVERCVRDAEVVGSNPVASTTWQGQPETLILSAFPVLFMSLRRQF